MHAVKHQISEEEISFLTQGEDPYDDNVVRKLYHDNLKLLLVTEGPEGCRYYTKVCCLYKLTSNHSKWRNKFLSPKVMSFI